MRPDVDRARIDELLSSLGRRVRAPHTLYLVGGSSAVLVGWRASTRDVDVRPEPDSDEVLHALNDLKDELDLNIELASPLDFLPELEAWRDRSPYVGTWGALHVRHLDFRLQALAKLERGLDTDLGDAREMLSRGLVSAAELREGFAAMRNGLFRFPAVDVRQFERRLSRHRRPGLRCPVIADRIAIRSDRSFRGQAARERPRRRAGRSSISSTGSGGGAGRSRPDRGCAGSPPRSR